MIFRKMHAFGCHGKHYFPENDFRLTTNFPFDHGNPFQFLFSLQMISGTGDAQGRTRELTDTPSIVKLRSRRRSEAPVRSTAQSTAREAPFARSRDLAIDGAQITLREIAIDANGASRDRAVDRDLAERRATLRKIANGASLTVDLANGASAPSISRTVLRRRRSRRFFWVL